MLTNPPLGQFRQASRKIMSHIFRFTVHVLTLVRCVCLNVPLTETSTHTRKNIMHARAKRGTICHLGRSQMKTNLCGPQERVHVSNQTERDARKYCMRLPSGLIYRSSERSKERDYDYVNLPTETLCRHSDPVRPMWSLV